MATLTNIRSSILKKNPSSFLRGTGDRGGIGRRQRRRPGSQEDGGYSPLSFSIFSCFILQSMQRVVTGLAISLFSEIGPPQTSQMPKTPSSIRLMASCIFMISFRLPVADPELEIPVRFEGGPVVGVGIVFLHAAGHLRHGLSRLSQKFVDLLGQHVSEKFDFFRFHRRFLHCAHHLLSGCSIWGTLLT